LRESAAHTRWRREYNTTQHKPSAKQKLNTRFLGL